jgi:hypothetical protein
VLIVLGGLRAALSVKKPERSLQTQTLAARQTGRASDAFELLTSNL